MRLFSHVERRGNGCRRQTLNRFSRESEFLFSPAHHEYFQVHKHALITRLDAACPQLALFFPGPARARGPDGRLEDEWGIENGLTSHTGGDERPRPLSLQGS